MVALITDSILLNNFYSYSSFIVYPSVWFNTSINQSSHFIIPLLTVNWWLIRVMISLFFSHRVHYLITFQILFSLFVTGVDPTTLFFCFVNNSSIDDMQVGKPRVACWVKSDSLLCCQSWQWLALIVWCVFSEATLCFGFSLSSWTLRRLVPQHWSVQFYKSNLYIKI